MKIVITGGAGFIGSHLADYWIERKAEVHIIDNLRTGKMENISDMKKIIFHKGNILDGDLVNEVLKNATYIFNLAALVSVQESVEKPIECMEINVGGLINLLNAARRHKVKKLIHSSSAAVYGNDPALPKKVGMLPKPKSPYGITKLDGELYNDFYSDGNPVVTIPTPNMFFIEEFIHIPLLSHPAPKQILLLGGGADGAVSEIMKHKADRIDYIELDPLLVYAIKEIVPSYFAAQIATENVNLTFADGRYFMENTQNAYDVVLLGFSNQ